MSKYYFVVNPASKSGRGIEIWNSLKAHLAARNMEYDVVFSERHGHVAELVRNITTEHSNDPEPVNVIILGGDGTLDEALQGIANFENTNIGYIPTGSGNDFARSLDYTQNAIETLDRIIAIKEPRIYDLGKLEYLNMTGDRSRLHNGNVPTTHYFDVSAGIGFDAGICERALASKSKDFLNKIGLGKLIYLFIAIKLIFGDSCPDATLILDGGEEIKVKKLRFIVGMNTCYEGGGFKFAPKAVPDDGYLDICQVNDISSFGCFGVLPGASKGKHVKNKHVHTYHVKEFEVKTDEPLWVHTDGEVYTKSSHIKVSVVPGVLRFLL